MSMQKFPPERIICLSEETVETLYLLGEEQRIVGVTGYAVRPPEARKDKPRVSAFVSANVEKIISLEPDLVLTFSDLQAEIVQNLLKRGVTVMSYNQRNIRGIIAMIRHLGSMVGASDRADKLACSYEKRLKGLAQQCKKTVKPNVYFEEWNDPMITAIRWVSELIEIAGGREIFSKTSKHQAATKRVVTSEQVISASPDVIIASWCGKKVRKEQILKREGWQTIPAVINSEIYEIKSPLILQPGPAALTDGLDKIIEILN